MVTPAKSWIWDLFARSCEFATRGDLVSSGIVIGLLVWVGAKIVAAQPRIHSFGKILAAMVLVVHLIHAVVMGNVESAEDLTALVVRGCYLGLLCLGVSWCGLAMIAFIAGVLVVWLRMILRTVEGAWGAASQLFVVSLRGIGNTFDVPRRWLASRNVARDRRRNDESQRSRLTLQQQLRLQCELAYSARMGQIDKHLSREEFRDLLDRYFDEQSSRTELENNADMILGMLRAVAAEPGQAAGKSLTDIAAFFDQQTQELRQLGLDADTFDSMLAQLNERRQKTILEHLNHVSR